MQLQPLEQAAARFAEMFPAVLVDHHALHNVLREAKGAGGLEQQLSALAFGLIRNPPVSSVLMLFVQHMVTALLRQQGDPERSSTATELIDRITQDLPAAGLTVVVAAARSGVLVDELRRMDVVIGGIHTAVKDIGGTCRGPREHANGIDEEAVTASQWDGHVTEVCQPRTSHDLLVILASRSVGVGENLAVSRRLRVPIQVAWLAGSEEPSCRLQADGDLIGEPILDIPDDEIALEVANRVAQLAPVARAGQIARAASIADSHQYRRYLADRDGVQDLPAWAVDALGDPYKFAALSRVELDSIADLLGALREPDLRNLGTLPAAVRSAYFKSAKALSPHLRRELLSAGLAEMVLSASDRRPQREIDWVDRLTWDRLKDALLRERIL